MREKENSILEKLGGRGSGRKMMKRKSVVFELIPLRPKY